MPLDLPFANVPAFPAAIGQGWAFVATDYAGMAAPGVAPYLVGMGEARCWLGRGIGSRGRRPRANARKDLPANRKKLIDGSRPAQYVVAVGSVGHKPSDEKGSRCGLHFSECRTHPGTAPQR